MQCASCHKIAERHGDTVSQKGDTILLSISLLNIDRFSQFFHQRTQLELCNKIINKRPHLTSDVLLHYLVKC